MVCYNLVVVTIALKMLLFFLFYFSCSNKNNKKGKVAHSDFTNLPALLFLVFSQKDTDLSEHLQAEHLKADSSLDTSSCATNVSDDIEIIEYFPVKNKSRSSDDIEIIEYFPVKKKSRSYPMSVENIQHLYYNFLSC
jgi:hypothetical protein